MCLVISDSLRGMSLQEKWTYEGAVSLAILFFTHCATNLLSHSKFLITLSGYAWRRSKITTSWCCGCTLHDWWRTIRTNLLNSDSLVVTFRTHARLLSSQFSCWQAYCFCVPDSLMSGWVCQSKPFWIPVGETFQKAYLEEWVYAGDDSSDKQGFAKFLALVQGIGNKGYPK